MNFLRTFTYPDRYIYSKLIILDRSVLDNLMFDKFNRMKIISSINFINNYIYIYIIFKERIFYSFYDDVYYNF